MSQAREVCKAIKLVSPTVPVLILSAITEVIDKVLLFELGADDYVTKPFSPRGTARPGSGSPTPHAASRTLRGVSLLPHRRSGGGV